MKRYFENCTTKEQLEKEHKRLVIKMHPDRNPDNPKATEEFQEMQAQYEERKAELNGDYTKARKGRERREREEKERREQERRDRERRKVETVIEQARLNRQKLHTELKTGDYVYARMVQDLHKPSNWDVMTCEELLWVVAERGVKDECIVKIEMIIDEQADSSILGCGYALYKGIPEGEVLGGYEVLQSSDPKAGIRKGKHVAKVVMFRSPSYAVFANPKGDSVISDYYMPVNYEYLFSGRLGEIRARLVQMKYEKEQQQKERKARLTAEQKPLIAEWEPKLIGISAALSGKERVTVAVSNMKTVLKQKFPGVTFRVSPNKWGGMYDVKWEDGPTDKEVQAVTELFKEQRDGELTPWQERYGSIVIATVCTVRKMSVLTKARILQQLGSVADAFREKQMDDDVAVSDFDWIMLHAMAGIDINAGNANEVCDSKVSDGVRMVSIQVAVRYIFNHTSYVKPKATKKKAA